MKILNFILIVFTILVSEKIFAQTSSEIKDVINIYTKVTSFESASIVNVTSSIGFKAGDTVMIAQMSGAIYSLDDPNVIDNPANVGKYELTVIGAVSANKITFNSPLKSSYDQSEFIQLIRVPSYNDAIVVDKLTCSPWDGTKGGVLVLVANRSVTLNSDIDVSGKGFRGKPPITYAVGKCFGSSGVPFTTYNILNASADSTSGLKGDGISTNQFVYTMGKGPAGNGGGAGTGAFAGGGGGGNYGLGGNGAKEKCATESQLNWGGNGGGIDAQYFSNSFFHRRIYMGGGGGSGIQKTSSSGSAGGNGGGIVIILTSHLITNSHYIKANGQDVEPAVTDGSSSGGGGGGGMILLTVDSVKNDILNVSARGGNGGSSASSTPCEGQGGGGGGGFIWFTGKDRTFTTFDVSGGKSGTGSGCDVSSTSGNKGDSLNRLLLPLTGFLNNTITSVSKTCYNTRVIVKGSRPQGGNGEFTFLWEYRNYGSTSWLPAPGKNDSVDYRTPFLTDTTEFRRIVSSDGMNDVSRLIKIDVFPQIVNNIVDPDTIVCYGSLQVKVRGAIAGGGIGNFTYEWTRRTLTGSWELATGINSGLDYSAPTDVTRFYRRKATSDYCSTYDSVKVEVLPLISNNLVTPRQTVCTGSTPSPYLGSEPSGGSGSYAYLWQWSTDSLVWSNTSVSAKDFSNPVVLPQTTYYRRLVLSGLKDCCRDTSKNIKVIVLPTITNNTIAAPQTICQDTKPELFTGSNPEGGDISTGYRYKWESSENNIKWDSIQYSHLLADFQAVEQDTTKSFRRIVYSGLNDCCKSISNPIKITVQPKIKNNTILGDTAICDNATPALVKGAFSSFTGGDGTTYASRWMRKSVTGSWQDIPGALQYTYQPGALTDTIWYQRVISSGTCVDYSNIVKINVLNTIQGNQITGNNVVCEGFQAGQLSSENITGGEPNVYRFTWEKSTDQVSWSAVQGEADSQLLPGVLPQSTHFRRRIKSGPFDCCVSLSNSFLISVDKLPSVPKAEEDKDLIFQDTSSLYAEHPLIGTGIWTSSSDAVISNVNSNKTRLSGLKFGRYVFYWTITNGVCPSVTDSVVINISDLQRYTGFSPNNDGVNDYFVVDGISNAPNKELTIINRWGVEVFHSPDYKNDWDGKSKSGEDLPEDTYFYILKVKDIYNAGKSRVYQNFVVIKR